MHLSWASFNNTPIRHHSITPRSLDKLILGELEVLFYEFQSLKLPL
jgi:hypothetical protein